MIAVIPARSGSKGVVNKNIKKLGKYPLIAHTILFAKRFNTFSRIIVSTDSQKYADIAKSYGAEVPFLRPSSISDDHSTDYDFFYHLIKELKLKNEHLAHLRPTTPIRDMKVVKDAINFFNNNSNASSLRSGHKAAETPFKWMMKDCNGYFRPLKEGLTSKDINNPRQSFEDVFITNGYIDIVKSDHIIKNKELHGNKMIVFETPVTYQVDTKEDFDFIEYKYKLTYE